LLKIAMGSAGRSAMALAASNTTSEFSVALDRTAATFDPSGDHVGNPKLPSASVDSATDRPPASMIESDASWLSTAIDPDDAIGPVVTVEDVGSVVGVGAAVAAGLANAAVAAGVDEGAGPPQAAARRAIVVQPSTSHRTLTISGTIRGNLRNGSGRQRQASCQMTR
jgi:hypothetical protein